ncbi:MAG: DUF4394 domain-containing protein, partial [Calditrichaeota bacterium]
LAMDPTDGTMYASSSDVFNSSLYTVDLSTGAVTRIGAITNAPLIIAIAVSPSGQMYGVDIFNDNLISIDKATGAGTVVGPIGFDANFSQGMDFDESDGTLYMAAYNAATGGELRTVDVTTGATTLIGPLGSVTPGGDNEISGFGVATVGGQDCPWLSENPVSGTVPPGGNQNVTITADATGLTPGSYDCNIVIHSNDPVGNPVTVPVHLLVTPPGGFDALVWDATGTPLSPQQIVEKVNREKGQTITLKEAERLSHMTPTQSATEIVNALTNLGLTSNLVFDITSENLNNYNYVFVVLGQYPNNHVIPAGSIEATKIENYIAGGGHVYMEGGDVWYYDPLYNSGHDFGPTFGINPLSDGYASELTNIVGHSFATGLDYAYNIGSDNWPDHIDPTGTGFLVHENTSPLFNCGIGNEPAGRTIGTSFEFGQLIDGSVTKTNLMAAYINFFDNGLTPDITVTPSSFTFTVPPGGTDTQVMTIGNVGNADLNWNITEQSLALLLPGGKKLPVTARSPNLKEQETGEPLPPQLQKHYPTSIGIAPEELRELHAQQQPQEVTTPLLGPTDSGFGPEGLNGVMVETVLNDPQNLIAHGTLPPNHYAAAEFGNTGDFSFMYALDYYNNLLVTIDVATGTVTTIGPATPFGSEYWSGLAMDPTDGTMYASSTDVFNSSLYTVDLSTGAFTRIGAITNAPTIIAIAVSPSGQMYGVDIFNDNLISIDKTTGAGTVVGPLGFDANYSQGMDFDESDGTLYMAAYNNGIGGELRIVDVTTGATTLIGPLGSVTPGGDNEITGFGVATGGAQDCPWLSENPVNGTVPPGGNQNVNITVDATGLTPGTYNCNLLIHSN